MKLLDANILLYAVNRGAVEHERVKPWLEAAINGDETIGLAWIVLLAFLRLTTRPGVFEKPLSLAKAISHVDEWIAQPNVRLIVESDEHWLHLQTMLRQVGTVANRTTDAHLAAIALSTGASVASCDSDFQRFPQIKCENPLTDAS